MLGKAVFSGLTALVFFVTSVTPSVAAPEAFVVMDVRSGAILAAKQPDRKLAPASLTKMMTLYLAFEAIESGRIHVDKKIRISQNAAREPSSKLYLKAGSRVSLRYLIRATAVKSANDAATAIAEAIGGSESNFANMMTARAKQMGMNNTRFRNAHGLTAKGHYSTARDMSILGRRLFYDFPDYYNLFSRKKTDAGLKWVNNTNGLLSSYQGADGIKTGYTRAAGYNLVASAYRGRKRIIATLFGGKSTAQRNAKVARLLDEGFRRAPRRVAVVKPPKLGAISAHAANGLVIKAPRAMVRSSFPKLRPQSVIALANIRKEAQDKLAQEILSITQAGLEEPADVPKSAKISPEMDKLVRLVIDDDAPSEDMQIAASNARQVSTNSASSFQRKPARVNHWAVHLGSFNNSTEAEKHLVQILFSALPNLEAAEREVVKSFQNGVRRYEARFVKLTEKDAHLACKQLHARAEICRAELMGDI